MAATLIHTSTDLTRHVQFGAIQAAFTQINTEEYEVLLEISSHKFFLHLTGHEGAID